MSDKNITIGEYTITDLTTREELIEHLCDSQQEVGRLEDEVDRLEDEVGRLEDKIKLKQQEIEDLSLAPAQLDRLAEAAAEERSADLLRALPRLPRPWSWGDVQGVGVALLVPGGYACP